MLTRYDELSKLFEETVSCSTGIRST